MTELTINLTNAANQHFSFVIEKKLSAQGITGIFGPSGSGKTTLLRAIAGLNKNVQGEIVFNGKTL